MSYPLPSQLPLYAQVEGVLTGRIMRGELPEGSQLPSEEVLIEEFNVSRTTIRATIRNLVQAGLIEIRRGKGTFVVQRKITQELTELTGFVEDMEVLGRRATARVLGREVIKASETVARKLDIVTGSPVVQIYRVRLADDVPLSFDETYLPEDLGRKVMDNDLVVEPIFSLLEQRYETSLLEAEYHLEASLASPAVAMALNVGVGSPVFLIERTSYSVDRRPVDYEKLYYRGDLIRFKTRLARRVPAKMSSN